MDVTRTITLAQPYAEVVPRVREALGEQGFGVLTEIDMTATMKQKRGTDIEDFVISAPAIPNSPNGPWTSTAGSGSCSRATSPSGRPPTARAPWCS